MDCCAVSYTLKQRVFAVFLGHCDNHVRRTSIITVANRVVTTTSQTQFLGLVHKIHVVFIIDFKVWEL
jgi:hypothetical protein